MNTILLNSNQVPDTTTIPNLFIDEYMPSANGSYVKVYLYLIRCLSSNKELTLSSIADHLDDTEKDIIRALAYWEKVDLIALERDKGGAILSITIHDMGIRNTLEETSKTISEPALDETSETRLDNAEENEEDSRGEISAALSEDIGPFEKPTYSQAQIDQLTNTDEVQWLLSIVEIYLERLIKPTELQFILYLYESLGFSKELILYLYEYCISKNKKNLSYIEAVALSWAKDGIDTVEKAEASAALYNNNYNAVNKAFGLNRAPGQVERQYIDKWVHKYGFSSDLIVEACNRTILATQKPDFKYTDKIMESWFKKGVKTLQEVNKLDEEHLKLSKARAANQTKAGTSKAAPNPNNRFNAFPQRAYTNEDYSSMEQRLLHKNK